MYSIGISCNFHDSAISVLKDGELIFFSMEDRFSRVKHDSRFPEHAIKYVKEEILKDINNDEIESICFYEDNELKFLEVLNESVTQYPHRLKGFYRSIPEWIFNKFWIKSKMALAFDKDINTTKLGNHHLSHALYGHYSSGRDHNIVVCSDGYGDRHSLSIYQFSGNTYKELLSFNKESSLGLVYTAFTTYFGFKANDGECSLMALSRFGEPLYVDKIRKILNIDSERVYKIDKSYFDFTIDAQCFFSDKFRKELGLPFQDPYTVSSFEQKDVSEEEQYYLDLASSFHFVFEEVYEAIFKQASILGNGDDFVFCGGVAQNCVLVERLERLSFINELHIPLDPGDGGCAIGAAIYGSSASKFNVNQMYCGAGLNQSEIDQSIKILKKVKKNVATELLGSDELAEKVYENLEQRKVVGILRGEMEVGPRALGNRSLICRADDEKSIKKLSFNIKTRALFRPYALIMLEEDAKECIVDYRKSSLLTRMQSVVKVKESFRDKLRFGLHIDGTTRVQIVQQTDNELLYRILKLKKEREGVSFLINTSFNESGLPLIKSPMDAVFFFLDKPLDAMIIGNYYLSK